jgi:hypothetical protein
VEKRCMSNGKNNGKKILGCTNSGIYGNKYMELLQAQVNCAGTHI